MSKAEEERLKEKRRTIYGRVRPRRHKGKIVLGLLAADHEDAKEAAVYFAVTGQLKADGKWPPNDITHAMGVGGYRYDELTMPVFLSQVKKRLKLAMPPFDFSFDSDFVLTAIGQKVFELIASVVATTK